MYTAEHKYIFFLVKGNDSRYHRLYKNYRLKGMKK